MITNHNHIHFIETAKTIHNDFYDYSKVFYVRGTTKVEIVCPKHGSFWQIPDAHKRGTRCPACAHETRFLSPETFLIRAKRKHGDRYDYSKVVLVGNLKNIEIICHEHGSFFCTPGNHLHKTKPTGCPACARSSTINHCIKRGYKTFVERSQTVFGDLYDYSKVDYKGAHVHVEIICKRHGSFWQTPANHYSGHHCAQCAHEDRPISIGENMIRDWLVDHNIPFQREKMFDDLINPDTGYHLRYDFFLIQQNVLVEFDGPHHFEPIQGDAIRLLHIKNLDIIKTAYAAEKGIQLVRISDKAHIDSALANLFN